MRFGLKIESYHDEEDNNRAKQFKKRKKIFIRCPICKAIYLGASGLISCGYCGYAKKGYQKIRGTITKLKTNLKKEGNIS